MSYQIGVLVGRLLFLLLLVAISVWCVRKVLRPGGPAGRVFAALGGFVVALLLLGSVWSFLAVGGSHERKVAFVRPNLAAATLSKTDAGYLTGWIKGFVGGLAEHAGYATMEAPDTAAPSAGCDAECVKRVAAETNASFVVTTEMAGHEGAYFGTLRINSASGEVVDSIALAGKDWQFAVNPVRNNAMQILSLFGPATAKK